MVGEPRREEFIEFRAMFMPDPLIGEIDADGLAESVVPFQFAQVAEMPRGQHHHHERHPVTAGEVAAVLTEDRIAQPRLALRR